MKFNLNLHKQILFKVLIDIFKDKSLSLKLAFKGGTCAMLFYDLPRISLDLDFDALDLLAKEDIEKIRMIVSRYGRIKDFKDKKNTVFMLLDYQVNAPNIKIEINKRIWKNNSYKFFQFMGIGIKSQDESTIFTNKLVAISDRKTPASRDLFDAYYFLKMGYPLNEELIKERTRKTKKEYIASLSSFVKNNFNAKNILRELSYLLSDEKQRAWVKTKLIDEFLTELKKVV